jgi:hypothetical protein
MTFKASISQDARPIATTFDSGIGIPDSVMLCLSTLQYHGMLGILPPLLTQVGIPDSVMLCLSTLQYHGMLGILPPLLTQVGIPDSVMLWLSMLQYHGMLGLLPPLLTQIGIPDSVMLNASISLQSGRIATTFDSCYCHWLSHVMIWMLPYRGILYVLPPLLTQVTDTPILGFQCRNIADSIMLWLSKL